jgi:hypothetical protein
MILTAHQPAYLPWLGYFAKLAEADVFVLHDLSRFDRGGFVNRNKIRTATGTEWLTVPVRHADLRENRTLNEIEIIDDGWRRRHWKAIQMAYRRAPFFQEHAGFLSDYYSQPYSNLTELCLPFLEHCMRELRLSKPIYRSSQLGLGEFDRTSIIPILCQRFSADKFVTGVHVRDYLEWDRAGTVPIEVFEYEHPEYPQLHQGFQSHLSILDLLMNCGPASLEIVRGARDTARGGAR